MKFLKDQLNLRKECEKHLKKKAREYNFIIFSAKRVAKTCDELLEILRQCIQMESEGKGMESEIAADMLEPPRKRALLTLDPVLNGPTLYCSCRKVWDPAGDPMVQCDECRE